MVKGLGFRVLGFRVLGLSPLGCGLLQEYKGPHEVKPSMGLIRDKSSHKPKAFHLALKNWVNFIFFKNFSHDMSWSSLRNTLLHSEYLK
jgi:hypothetical protein